MVRNMTGIAIVRTIVQGVLARLLATAFGVSAVTFLAETFGIDVSNPDTQAWIVEGTSVFLLGVVVGLVNKYGKNFAWINKVVSLGLSRTGPAYVPNDVDAVVSVANPVGVDTVTPIDTPPPGPDQPEDVPMI
jgi:hypothetical protein